MLKLTSLATLAFLAAGCVATSTPASDTNFTCSNAGVGCWTEYTGPRDKSAAQLYLTDAKNVSEWIVESYPDVEAAHYSLGRGELVIQLKKDGSHLNVPLREIMARFNGENLWLRNTLIMDNRMNLVLRSMSNIKKDNAFGRARFSALNDIMVGTAAAAVSSEKAFSSVRRDSFGNITVSF